MRRVIGTLLACLAVATGVHAAEYNGELSRPRATGGDRLIVKWRAPSAAGNAVRANELSSKASIPFVRKASVTPDVDVVELAERVPMAELETIAERLARDTDVAYVSIDHRRQRHVLPNDPLIMEQWYLRAAEPAATRAELAWDTTTGSPSTVVAVLDTGVRYEHPDLARANAGGKLLDGYDFISQVAVANDGNGRDSDASDPGDWVDANDTSQSTFDDCEVSDSSWHGTRVASLIAAVTNNGVGMAGMSWSAQVLPVRVMGKCGGFDSDIIAGMRWAAGLPVTGVPMNPTPAKIINLSLGGEGACTAAYQDAVDEVLARGVVIVASVGNEGGPVNAPANCDGVIGVTGVRHVGTKVGYSSLGPSASIAAPAGNCVNTGAGQACLFSILAATNSGERGPGASAYTDQLNFNVGTSFSAPLVAGAAALLHAVQPGLSPRQYRALLRGTAASFATSSTTATAVCHVPANAADVQSEECICTRDTCGAGMLNAQAAVLAATGPFAAIEAPATIGTGTATEIDASASFASAGRNIVAYQWSVVNASGAAPTIAAPTNAVTTVQVPAASEFTLRLTVTDDQGTVDTRETKIVTPTSATPPTAPTPPPSLPGGGGGGGGALGALPLLLAIGFAWRCRRTRRVR